jgi:hypothetical protein
MPALVNGSRHVIGRMILQQGLKHGFSRRAAAELGPTDALLAHVHAQIDGKLPQLHVS